jgi:hypothetical protein
MHRLLRSEYGDVRHGLTRTCQERRSNLCVDWLQYISISKSTYFPEIFHLLTDNVSFITLGILPTLFTAHTEGASYGLWNVCQHPVCCPVRLFSLK